MRNEGACKHDYQLFFRNGRAWLRCAFCQKEILHPLEGGDALREKKTKTER